MYSDRYKINNGIIITPEGYINGGCLLIADGKIVEVSSIDVDYKDATVIDAEGKYISPGFIDLHVHGGGGHDFMDNTVEAFLEIAKTHAKYGTTALTPTTLSSEKEDLLETLRVYEIANEQNTEGARFLGIHIEGPYFSMQQRGAQDPRYIRNPDPVEYKEILSKSKQITRWSAAPELPGALEFADCLKTAGILAAVAHTDAVYDEVIAGYDRGFTHATHFYSCMSGVTRKNLRRHAGVVESAYLLDGMTVEIIADGKHLPAPLLKLVYKIKGTDSTALITDAMRGAGMPAGPSILGGLKNGLPVIVEDNVAMLEDRSAFAGSVATTDLLVRNMIALAGVPLIEAVKMMSATPALIMKIDGFTGTLTAGKDADIVIFDEQINVIATMVKGRVVYSK